MIVNLDSTSTAGNINRLSDSKFQAFPIFWLLPENGSILVIFAITCQNNLCPAAAAATSLNSQTAQTQRQHRRLPDKRFDTASTGGELYSNRGAVFWKDSPWKSKVVSVGASVGALFRGRLQETHFENTKDSAAWANSNPLYKFDWPEESWEHLQVQTSWCQQSNFVVYKYDGKIGDSLSLYYRQTKNKATNELHGNELHLYYTSDPEWL